MKLRAPFPWFGGKRAIAELVWSRLGDVDNYIEPCCGTAAMLLLRESRPRIETINDADFYVANFWRAVSLDPERVAAYADWPVNEADLHARHRWLVLSEDAAEFRSRMKTDPDYFDAKVTGRWVWGLCCWIGGEWCRQLKNSMPTAEKCRTGGKGVNGAGPCLYHQHPNLSIPNGVHRVVSPGRRIRLGGRSRRDTGVGVCFTNGEAIGAIYGACASRRKWLVDWFRALQDRLRNVRVCCGDWRRVCSSRSVTTRLGITGIFFDPPYSAASRDPRLYAVDGQHIAGDIRTWCLKHGDNPKFRLALCGYAGEGHEALEKKGWQVDAWHAHGGYANRRRQGNKNAALERVWFSPGCLAARTLFDGLESK